MVLYWYWCHLVEYKSDNRVLTRYVDVLMDYVNACSTLSIQLVVTLSWKGRSADVS